MGNFYVNYATRGLKRDAVVKCLKSAKRKAYVSPTLDGTTVFFDDKSDAQDDAVIKDLGKRISKALNAPVLAIMNHDDDILYYWLFAAGKVADEYNSFPGYFTDIDNGDVPSGGDSKGLCAAFEFPTKAKQVDKVLRNQEYVFALDRHKDLAKLLKLPWPYVCMGYRDIKQGNLAEGVTKKDLLAVG